MSAKHSSVELASRPRTIISCGGYGCSHTFLQAALSQRLRVASAIDSSSPGAAVQVAISTAHTALLHRLSNMEGVGRAATPW